MKNTKVSATQVQQLAEQELSYAIEKYGAHYNSLLEACAVASVEFQEVLVEHESVNKALSELWECAKNKETNPQLILNVTSQLTAAAIRLVQESLQIIAVAMKTQSKYL